MTAICSICQEKLQSGRAVVLSHCGHVLCDGCLLQWASRNNPPNRVDCPMCRKKHSYPKHTAKLYFEEEKSDAELFRSEIRSIMKHLEKCAEEPTGASLAGIVNELKKLSKNGKKLGEPSVTTASISGLDAMVNHLSKKLAPIQSSEEVQATLEETIRDLEEYTSKNSRLESQCDDLEARVDALATEVAAAKQSRDEFRHEFHKMSRENMSLQEQLSQQRQKNTALQHQLSSCQETRESAREKLVQLKRKYKNITDANESLKLQINRALAGRRPSASPSNRPVSQSAPRLSRRGSIISIRSQSSPDAKHVSLSSDDEYNLPSESSSVEFISDSENAHTDPPPKFHELKLKPVKAPTALFQHTPQASSSKTPSNKSVQKRKLAATPHGPPNGLELRNGKLTGLAVIGPKRSKKC